MKEHRLVGVLAAALFLLCLTGIVRAQTQPWDTNVLTWTAPTTCSTGEPISACPVTGYRIEQSATATGIFTTVAAVGTVLTYSHTGVSAGQHCYRVISLAATSESMPSNVACKTNVKPAGPPNPPVLTVAQVVAGVPYAPLYRQTSKAGIGSTLFGFVPVGRDCGPFVVRWRNQNWHLVTVKQSDLWYTSDGTRLVAPCA